ncbi:heavy metal sensor kinase [Thermosporothrix hazakensis]|jgi:heavy metal sensor kinase|uniref:histidine kinase n=2 Tax=Thermosporothrix TaxID=768650 RepID=A0A326UE97_THEHA|nr:HAMP domain-containing sensor histidine kinase [Thermosporothrix hazakensis]PZW36245.1 heavy metal sensor kinase [Thermosporothrix hazakensis]BBH88708.1 hypothetical protein KTC_34590 [Thermosporothrix sp. COM3]GCE46894.1 hypothetical protein KTH_17630 [Thermosporothrix hazakensis]
MSKKSPKPYVSGDWSRYYTPIEPKHSKRRLTPPGIRLQLTLWYSVVSATLIFLCALAFYAAFERYLFVNLDTTLHLRAQQIAEGMATGSDGRLRVVRIISEEPELDASAVIVGNCLNHTEASSDCVNRLNDTTARSQESIYVRILDRSRSIIYSTANLKDVQLPLESLDRPEQGQPWEGTVNNGDDEAVRFYSTMLIFNGKIVGVIQVGQKLALLYTRLRFFLFVLLILCPVLLTMSGIVSYWLAGRAFRPIRRLTRTARAIGARDLDQRVPLSPARDEVRELTIIFNQMIGRLERAFAQQRRFVADASHELRTPVAVIRNMTEVALTQAKSKEDYICALEAINDESDRLGRLVSDLLALARVDEERMPLDSEPVRLDFLAADVVDSMASFAAEHGITLQTGTLQPATVKGDAARLIQVLMGLVDNAVKYTNAGGTVTVAVEACASHVHCSVTDTGIGIAREHLPHIFERFYRADPARSKAVGGSGLGLSIIDWLVRAHHGAVTVESEPGKGSTFMITLPLMH